MRIVCISDTHMFHDAVDVPEGDVLIHAGDLCGVGTLHYRPDNPAVVVELG